MTNTEKSRETKLAEFTRISSEFSFAYSSRHFNRHRQVVSNFFSIYREINKHKVGFIQFGKKTYGIVIFKTSIYTQIFSHFQTCRFCETNLFSSASLPQGKIGIREASPSVFPKSRGNFLFNFRRLPR